MNNSNIIMYTTEDGLTKIETTFDEDTVWLSIDQMAELFQRDKSTISRHIKNIFGEGELFRDSVVANFATTASDGKTYNVDYYNLDVIISVGYRVKSHRGTQFRIWAMGILKEYMRKGFALDDERLKRLGGGNYFDELLARIRDIRSSEKVFWRKVLEIYATSIDYDPHAESSIMFFKQVQNKMHWAAHKHTAAEVIYQRAGSKKENMGLTSWGGDVINMTVEEEAEFLMLCNVMENMPHIPEALEEFEKMGIPMYVLSNSGFTAEALSILLEKLGIRKYFKNIWSSADFGKIKPSREFFDMAINNALADNPTETKENIVFVGDTYSTDVKGANDAGIDVIWLNYKGEENRDNLKVCSISDTGELVECVKRRSKGVWVH